MLNLLWEYRFVILAIIAIALYAWLEWEKFKVQAYAIMLQAKRQAKDKILKSGAQQEEWVVRKAYQFLPKRFTIFISEKNMRWIVHKLYHIAKDKLDDGKLNNSIE